MQKKKTLRVNYRINHCSSQDPQYPVSELLLQSPDAKGWQSKRFCSYPQIIVIQLVEPTILKQISVLSHQSKIATKIQIQTKLDTNKQWKRLGFMSLQSNASTNYQARQLRTVKIADITSLMLRFTFHTNYVNNHNIFNQVGIVSLCASGDKMITGTGRQTPNLGGMMRTDFDKNILNKLKTLQIQKKEAIQSQDYDRAKNIKDQIQRLKNSGQALVQLQEKKQQAIRNQNYEDAKIINEKIKKLREMSGGGPNFSTRPSGSSSDYYRQHAKIPKQKEDQEDSISPITPNITTKSSPKPPLKSSLSNQLPKSKNQLPPKNYDHDQLPINVKTQNPYQNFDQEEEKITGNQPAGQLQQLNKQLKAQCSAYFSVIDQQIFRHIFSKHHLHRENGLELARGQIQGSNKSREYLATAGLFIVKNTIDDKNIAVLTSSFNLFNIILKKCKPTNNPNNAPLIQYILDKLADYLGHNNQKFRQSVQDAYIQFPNYPATNKQLCYRMLTMLNPKRDKPPKILTGRLKVLNSIVESYQLGRNYDEVIRYATKYADDRSNQVRNSSVALITTICRQVGYPAVQDYLKNVRPQIIKSIEDKLGDINTGQQRPIRAQNQNKGRMAQKSRQKVPIRRQQYQQDEQNQFMENNPTKGVANKDYECQFCQRFDKKFQNQNYRDLHLFNACPMLTVCEQCKQAIQIKSMTSHLMGQCVNSKYYKKCPRCKEAVHQKIYKNHVESKQCIPSKPPAQANRCPLCHLDVQPGADGWRRHLAEQGCDNNPRK